MIVHVVLYASKTWSLIIKGREQGAEENIWTQGEMNNNGLKKIA
jgi:hypothetical protein